MQPQAESAETSLDTTDIQACVRVLSALAADPACLSEDSRREEIERLVASVYRRVRRGRRRQSEVSRREVDGQTVANTGRIAVERGVTAMSATSEHSSAEFAALQAGSRRCYVCNDRYRKVHHFYHLLCPACAQTNYARRGDSVDLAGRTALVTGGRIKIGYQTALKLLRCGARVLVTTRFPKDAAVRYASEPDFAVWQHRLTIYRADFRDVVGLLRFTEHLEQELTSLDILINNAAQSVRNSTEYLARLQQIESSNRLPANQMTLIGVEAKGSCDTDANLPALPLAIASASDRLDRHGELIDSRESHSWTHRLHDVEPVDLLETLLINANAPCLLASRLKPLMLRSSYSDHYIINVTGLDGQFDRTKSIRHPHVNMSKAALNMLTRTSARDYTETGIYMNSVDTGWITHVASHSRREQKRESGFVPPLDEIDGAARIVAPIFDGIRGEPTWGQLYRHFCPSTW